MYNRYVGNTGRFIRVDDEPVIVQRAEVVEQESVRERPAPRRRAEREEEPDAAPRRKAEREEEALPPSRGGSILSSLFGGGGSGLFGGGGLLGGGGGGGLLGGKGFRFLDNILPFGMDTGDLALIVLFFFLYIESGDDEFLIIMAFLAYSIFKERPKKLL